jgi:hypothetical protein
LYVILAFRFEDEAAAVRKLRAGRKWADAPGQGLEAMLLRRQFRLVCGVGPVLDVGTIRPARDAAAIEKEFVTLISADVED